MPDGASRRRSEETSYWEEVASDWDARRPDRLWRRHSDAVNSALVARWLGGARADRLLKTDLFDEACSEGLVSALEAASRIVVGIDLSASTVRAARARYPQLRAAAADVRRLPFPNDAFDAVVSNSTLDHFASQEEIRAGISELARTLRPGGQLLLTLDNLANPAVWLRNALPHRWLARLGLVPYATGATCGPRGARAHVVAAGLVVRGTTAIMHCPRVAAVVAARRLDRRGSVAGRRRFARALMAFERLERWPTRDLTGYFVAIRAEKPRAERTPGE